jgi:hypothetical protein
VGWWSESGRLWRFTGQSSSVILGTTDDGRSERLAVAAYDPGLSWAGEGVGPEGAGAAAREERGAERKAALSDLLGRLRRRIPMGTAGLPPRGRARGHVPTASASSTYLPSSSRDTEVRGQ